MRLVGVAEVDRRFAGQHAGARLQAAHRRVLICGDQLERGSHRAFGVVLACDGRAPDRHDGVTDELLDHAAMALDHGPRGGEVALKEVAHLLWIVRLGHWRETDDVGEQDA